MLENLYVDLSSMKNKKLFIIPILIITTILSLFILKQSKEIVKTNHFAILPHFMIAPKTVDNFYQRLQKMVGGDIEYIVLISPNHFGAGTQKIDSVTSWQDEICFQWSCVSSKNLFDISAILGDDNPKSNKLNPLFLEKNNKWITKEHGIGAHFEYIQKYFPYAKVVPLVIHPQYFSNAEKILEYLEKYKYNSKILFLASVDFSHYVQEDFALLHDQTSRYTINHSTQKADFEKLEVDCPPCLFLLSNLAKRDGQKANFRRRDSSSSLFHSKENTSRVFVYFDYKWWENIKGFSPNGVTLSFRWDSIYDRKLLEKYPDKNSLLKYLNEFSSPSRIGKHSLLNGIDLNIANLEWPILTDRTSCEKSDARTIRFCSDENIISVLKTIRINVLSLANNHIYDQWKAWLDTTINLLAKYNLDYTSNMPWIEEKILEKTIRGQKVRLFAFDLTKHQQNLDDYCKELSHYKEASWTNIVSVHRWQEYDLQPNNFQKSSARKLIDCWADAIIGHHPHVRQWSEYYQWKPIVYSVWNFIFDQRNKPETNNQPYALLNIIDDGKILLSTGCLMNGE